MMRQAKGFTLIEVLIAITLLGVMVVLLFASLRIAAESWDAADTKMTRVNRQAVVYQFFKRHLSDVRPLVEKTGDVQNPSEHMLFRGTIDGLRFVTSMPASAARKGLQIFTIAPDRQQSTIINVNLQPFSSISDRQTEPTVLLENVESLRFGYFGLPDDAVEDGQWFEQWNSEQRLPSLIKINITLKDEEPWPEMIVPLPVTGVNQPQSVADSVESDSLSDDEGGH